MTRDVATQVMCDNGQLLETYTRSDRSQDNSPRICVTCAGRLYVHGPYGQVRDAKQFARFFLQCIVCHTHGRPSNDTLWLEVGQIPSERMVSSKPRNLAAIIDHIKTAKQLLDTDHCMHTLKTMWG